MQYDNIFENAILLNNNSVAVLLPTYLGSKYLQAQLSSLAAQESLFLVLHALDDGSTDNTVSILQDFCDHPYGSVRQAHFYRDAPRHSSSLSFLALVRYALRDKQTEFFAFCDQDDIWLPNKLQAALKLLTTNMLYTLNRPALYGGRTLLVDSDNIPIGYSPIFNKAPCFENALVQNIMGGNTMVFNRAAALLLQAIDPYEAVPVHDWLLYQLVTGTDGLVVYDAAPYIRYRQHNANIIGGNTGWKARFKRIKTIYTGQLKHNINSNLKLLASVTPLLTQRNHDVLHFFIQARVAASFVARLRFLYRSGVKRETHLQQLAMYITSMINKL